MSTIYTRLDLKNMVLANLDLTGDTGTMSTNVNNWLQQVHQLRCTQQDWPFMLWDTAETFTTVSSTQTYALHQEFARPFYFFNRTTKAYLIETPGRSLAGTGARWNTDSSHPLRFTLWGRTQVQNQPTSASVLTISSSSAADNTAAKAITIRGVTADGTTTEAITPSGVTPVAGTSSFTKILGVTKGAAWTGTLTITSNSAAVTNVKLFASEYGRSYPRLFLLASPGTDTIEYRFYRQPSPFTSDYDTPDLPGSHALLLVWDTLLRYAGYHTDISAAAVQMWRDNQKDCFEALQHAMLEGQSLEAEPRYVRWIGDSADTPRIYTD